MTVHARDALENCLWILSFEDEFPGCAKRQAARIQRTCHSRQFNEERHEDTKIETVAVTEMTQPPHPSILWNTASSTIRPPFRCSTTIRSRRSGVTWEYQIPSGYTTTIGPPEHTPRQGVSPRLTRSGPKSRSSLCSSDARSEYSPRPRRSGEQNPPVHMIT